MDIDFSARMDSKRYPAVGRCIYCGRGDCKLTDEHIIPKSLGGRWILDKSSCENCAAETKRVEGICGREFFEVIRAYAGLSKTRSLTIEALGLDGTSQTHQVPINEHPSVMVMPLFAGQPGAISRKPLGPMRDIGMRTIELVEDSAERTARLALRFMADIVFAKNQLVSFARLIAKIAHGYAWAEQRLEGFSPVVDYYVANSDERFVQQFIFTDQNRYEASPKLHDIRFLEHDLGSVKFLTVELRLFSMVPASPVYYVIVGSSVPIGRFPPWVAPGEKENGITVQMF